MPFRRDIAFRYPYCIEEMRDREIFYINCKKKITGFSSHRIWKFIILPAVVISVVIHNKMRDLSRRFKLSVRQLISVTEPFFTASIYFYGSGKGLPQISKNSLVSMKIINNSIDVVVGAVEPVK